MSWTEGRPSGRTIPVSLHNRVVRAYGRTCYVCQEAPYEEIDHVIPWAEGGTDELDNLRPICQACHKPKTLREKDRGRKRRQAMERRAPEKHPSEG